MPDLSQATFSNSQVEKHVSPSFYQEAMNLAQASSRNLKNPKIGILEQEIEASRLKKDHVELADLVHKYHKKYFTNTTGIK
jgi:hypothetical protein